MESSLFNPNEVQRCLFCGEEYRPAIEAHDCLSKKKYQVIYADPPWFYNSRKAGAERKDSTKFGGGAEKHYPLMRDTELLALASTVQEWADENCALFLWATGPRLDFAVTLIQAWDFRYCTIAFVWEKVSQSGGPIYNPGYYTASNVELVLLGVRGSMRPAVPMIQQIVRSRRSEHSRKPDRVRANIEAMYPSANRIEMFARPINSLLKVQAAWDLWGNETWKASDLAVDSSEWS